MRFSTIGLTAIAAQGIFAQQGDLPEVQKQFPPGKDSGTPVLNIAIPKGPYAVKVESIAAFSPNRTIYAPQGVPAGVSIPVLSWGNGMCAQAGLMYKEFLTEIASHGYFIIAPGAVTQIYQTTGGNPSYPASWQAEALDMAEKWKDAPIKLDLTKMAFGGHSCGAGQSAVNTALDAGKRVKTILVINSSSVNATEMAKSKVPMLYINGGDQDNRTGADTKYATVLKDAPTLPIFRAILETGHLGSFWSPRGGIYAETVVNWLDWQLNGNHTAHKWFVGGDQSPAKARGWRYIFSNNIV